MQNARLFGVLRENALGAYDITYAGHYEKSLSSYHDSRCHFRKMKIISSDLSPPLFFAETGRPLLEIHRSAPGSDSIIFAAFQMSTIYHEGQIHPGHLL